MKKRNNMLLSVLIKNGPTRNTSEILWFFKSNFSETFKDKKPEKHKTKPEIWNIYRAILVDICQMCEQFPSLILLAFSTWIAAYVSQKTDRLCSSFTKSEIYCNFCRATLASSGNVFLKFHTIALGILVSCPFTGPKMFFEGHFVLQTFALQIV